MSITIDETQTQNFDILNNNVEKKDSKTSNSFDKSLEEAQVKNQISIDEDKESKEKLIEELLNKIREIVNSGINAELKDKIDKLIKEINESLKSSSTNTNSLNKLENLLSQLQSLMEEQTSNISRNMLNNVDMEKELEDLLLEFNKNNEENNQYNPINNYKRVDIEEELKKFQNIKLDI